MLAIESNVVVSKVFILWFCSASKFCNLCLISIMTSSRSWVALVLRTIAADEIVFRVDTADTAKVWKAVQSVNIVESITIMAEIGVQFYLCAGLCHSCFPI